MILNKVVREIAMDSELSCTMMDGTKCRLNREKGAGDERNGPGTKRNSYLPSCEGLNTIKSRSHVNTYLCKYICK